MIAFKLVKHIGKEALSEWPAWGQYHEPGDIDSLVECGYDREGVRSKIEATGWSDAYWFPIPDGVIEGTFAFEVRRTSFRTPKGKGIQGYICDGGHAIGLFGQNQEWIINANLLDMFEEERVEMLRDLGLDPEEELLPLEYEHPAFDVKRIFPSKTKSHPYMQFEGTALWETVDETLAELERNQDIQITTSREYIIGVICKDLHRQKFSTDAAMSKGSKPE